MSHQPSAGFRIIAENYPEYLKARYVWSCSATDEMPLLTTWGCFIENKYLARLGIPTVPIVGVFLHFMSLVFQGSSDESLSSKIKSRSASQTGIHLRAVKFAKLEKVSTCQWLNCGTVIANSVQGITLHLSLSHGVDVAEVEDCVNCFWNDCCT